MNRVRMPLPIALLSLRFASAQQPSGQAQREGAEVMRQTLQQLTPEEKSHLQANRHVNRAEWIKGRRIQLVRGKEDRADPGWDKPHAPHWAVVERLKAAGAAPNQVQAAWVRQANPGQAGPLPVR